ncbi:hypothetical protein COT75_02945 [Candidatus Beckwithbacteria bacterium CG10_big_fil_rev_8_21_14_0_10_34_10]|uniref:Glycosyltransferase RgtA/B/C/D-like domain-containing protein n=1 Tax=Candidatus Beckwithbacteria bacterium CG10_big_fil_rev_8_21_14_0_10_34_10 TaxID=1974495 RepID=A0A2H0W964_9BACT|nr:MAG: hypothetical protein COT75_02945 [Candidatus Beckwithbacteria bacterium CG10_big_fil_rev_8_21_14_0_10_34_10]
MKKQNIILALLVTAVFSLRWQNCLPFSGKMPVITNSDVMSIWGRYLIFAKENFSFPLGSIKSLSFPFQTANITRAFPLFSLILKFLSKIFPLLGKFYYFPLVEIMAVFLTAYFTCLLLDKFKVRWWPIKLLGAVLVSLSPALLFRSSFYYGISMQVYYFPLYLIFSYLYICFYKKPSWRLAVILALVFPLSSLIAYYLSFGISFIFLVLLGFNILEFTINKKKVNQKRLIRGLFAFVLGLFLSSVVFSILGNQDNLKVPPETSLFTTRFRTNWGYGGGFGSGFHVADVLTLFIPPEESPDLLKEIGMGPTAYLAKAGFPLTSRHLQAGQYEGFAYLGTVTISLLLFYVLIGVFNFYKNPRSFLMKLRMKWTAKIFFLDHFFSLPFIFASAAFLLYVLSWGNIIHLGGIRFNDLPTPTLLIAMFWRQFIFVRSIGRFAIPLMLFITLGLVVYLNKFLQIYLLKTKKKREFLVILLMVFLSIAHIGEIKGYLKAPEKVVYGNEITQLFSKKDQMLIKRVTQDKKALIIAPKLRSGLEWEKIGYALALYSSAPLSGATVGAPGEREEHLKQYDKDISDIISGNVKELVDRYGEIVIVVKSEQAEEIIKKSNFDLKYNKLDNSKVAILTLVN